MKVEEILRNKGTSVVTIQSSASIKDAVSVLGERNIGAVVVKGDRGELSGILSERDIVRELCNTGASMLEHKVASHMTPSPYTCGPEATVDELMVEMTEKRVRHMPVMANGQLIGVVSIGDVVKRKIETAEKEAEALKEYIAS